MIALLGVFALGTVANAQYASSLSDTSLSDISLRVGASLPIDSKLNDRFNTFAGIGIDYHLKTSLVSGSASFLSADWTTGDSKFKSNAIALMINQRWALGGMQNKATYGYLGLGAVIVDAGVSKTVVGIRGGVGIEMSKNVFGELTAVFSDKVGNARYNVLGAYIGYRF